MIRREQAGSTLLIAQHDHALLAGRLAGQFGNDRFPRPEPFEATVRGVMLHDSGWPLHDDNPTLNDFGLPLDVFEAPRSIALAVWAAGADRAAQADPYAGLLTSLHVLALSVYAVTLSWNQPGKYSAQDLFAVNKFQHREVERQESLRRQLGMRTDRPLEYGLSREEGDAAEDQLKANLRLLQAMDQISLAVCCTAPPMPQTLDVAKISGGRPLSFCLLRSGDDLSVGPWPFAGDEIALQVPARRLPAGPFASQASFQAAYASAVVEMLPVRIHPGSVG
jgi:hypothetical protein